MFTLICAGMTNDEQHEDSPLSIYASCGDCVHNICKYCLISPQNMAQKLRDIQSCVAPIERTADGDMCPLALTLVLVVPKRDTTDCNADYVILHSEKVFLLQKKCAESRLMCYRVRHPTHPPHPAHASSTASTCMWHESACFSQITMHRFKYTSVRFRLRSECRRWYSLSAARGFPQQKPSTKCMSAYSA
jgi:hypothetical protein